MQQANYSGNKATSRVHSTALMLEMVSAVNSKVDFAEFVLAHLAALESEGQTTLAFGTVSDFSFLEDRNECNQNPRQR